ncbi:MAG: carboxypeptidase Taq [Myxococcota bacterium]|jgi:carboxypeptidase Taq
MGAWEDWVGYNRETAALNGAYAVVQWDQQTYMPAKAGAFRGEQLATLGRLVHERNTDPRVAEWIAAVGTLPDPTPVQVGALRNQTRSYERSVRIPTALVGALTQASSDGFGAWMAAREASDFGAFAPTLERIVGLTREKAAAIDSSRHPYDVMLEEFEPSADTASLRAMFDRLSGGLTELLDAIRGADALPAHTEAYDVGAQLELFREVADALGYDRSSGRVDLAAHPFTISMGPGDTRITVRCAEHDLLAGLGGCVHEAGHALYEQGLPSEWVGTGVEDAASMGLHESQSRFWENFIGRSRPFFCWLAPRLATRFGRQVDPEVLYRAANRVVPGLIRVEADEVTYNLHVIIRFELELALLDGSLAVADLPDAWNARYQSLLGVAPPDDAHGVLQDVHWSGGMFGYFPSYTIGNLYAASLGAALEGHLPGLWEGVEAGDFTPVRDWLRHGLHQHAHVKEAPELMADVIGKRDHVADLLDHLWRRQGALHGVTRGA